MGNSITEVNDLKKRVKALEAKVFAKPKPAEPKAKPKSKNKEV